MAGGSAGVVAVAGGVVAGGTVVAGVSAVWKIDVETFPAFVVVNDRDDDFFDLVSTAVSLG